MRTSAKRLLLVGGLGAGWCWLVRARGAGSPYRFPADVTDAAIIPASPDAVYQALIAEGDGETDWWAPHHRMRLRRGDSCADVGAIVDNTVLVRGRFPIRFVTRTASVVPGEEIRIEYIDGAFRGAAQWSLRAADGGTRVSLRWRTTPAGSLGTMAAILPVEKSHSDTMKVGFEKLDAYLARHTA